jgi:hypothetical protein
LDDELGRSTHSQMSNHSASDTPSWPAKHASSSESVNSQDGTTYLLLYQYTYLR